MTPFPMSVKTVGLLPACGTGISCLLQLLQIKPERGLSSYFPAGLHPPDVSQLYLFCSKKLKDKNPSEYPISLSVSKAAGEETYHKGFYAK